MLVALLEEPEGALLLVHQAKISSAVQVLIDNHVIDVLLPYCIEPSTHGVSKGFQLLCSGLLEKCVKHGQEVPNKAKVKAAIEKSLRKW